MNRAASLRRPWIWSVYLVLFALSVPWYLPSTTAPALWFGFPYWVLISLAAIGAIACYTAWIIHRYWPTGEDESP